MNYRRSTNYSNGTCRSTELKKGSVLRVKGNRFGRTVRCLDGMVWITQQGDREDRFLNGGELYLSNLPGFILVSALNDAQVMVCQEEKERTRRWSPQVWQGALSGA